MKECVAEVLEDALELSCVRFAMTAQVAEEQGRSLVAQEEDLLLAFWKNKVTCHL